VGILLCPRLALQAPFYLVHPWDRSHLTGPSSRAEKPVLAIFLCTFSLNRTAIRFETVAKMNRTVLSLMTNALVRQTLVLPALRMILRSDRTAPKSSDGN
jgi:hypothetical protein